MNRLTILFILLFTSLTVSGQDIYKLSINELLEKGEHNSLPIQTLFIKSKIAKKEQSLARNKYLPDIRTTGQIGYVGQSAILDREMTVIAHPKSPKWKQNYQIVAIQPIYQGGRIRNNIKRSDLENNLSELFLSKDKSSLKLWLIAKYLNLYSLYQQKNIYSISIKESKIRLQNIKKMKEQGMITTNDVLRSQILLSNYELLNEEVVNNISLESQQLAIAMGMPEDIVYQPDSAILSDLPNVLNSLDHYIETAYTNNFDIGIAKTNINLAEVNLQSQKADFLPSLSLQAGNTFQRPIPNSTPIQDMYINSWGISLNLSYRLSALFDRKHVLSIAKEQIDLQEIAYKQSKQDIRINVKTYYLKRKEALDKVAVLNQSLEQANENYRIVGKKYFNQLAILTDLLDANSVQLTAQLDLIDAKINAIYTYYQLLNICGIL